MKRKAELLIELLENPVTRKMIETTHKNGAMVKNGNRRMTI